MTCSPEEVQGQGNEGGSRDMAPLQESTGRTICVQRNGALSPVLLNRLVDDAPIGG